MVSAGISALLKKMDYKDVVVAIDGSVFRFHPHFPNIMKSRIAQLMGIDYKFDLMLSTDGSGRGAALVAAVSQTQIIHTFTHFDGKPKLIDNLNSILGFEWTVRNLIKPNYLLDEVLYR